MRRVVAKCMASTRAIEIERRAAACLIAIAPLATVATRPARRARRMCDSRTARARDWSATSSDSCTCRATGHDSGSSQNSMRRLKCDHRPDRWLRRPWRTCMPRKEEPTHSEGPSRERSAAAAESVSICSRLPCPHFAHLFPLCNCCCYASQLNLLAAGRPIEPDSPPARRRSSVDSNTSSSQH